MEVDIEGARYRSEKLDCIAQFHLARRLTPVLPGLLGTVLKTDFTKIDAGTALVLAAGPVGQALAMMPQEDADYVVYGCLRACSRQEGSAWAPLLSPQGVLMYKDLPFIHMMRLVIEVIKENLGGFFPVGDKKA